MTDCKHSAPEEWRSLAPMGFRHYDVSSYGRVRSYKHIDAANERAVHLTGWHGPQPSPKHVVGHRFDVKTMNTPETLSWVTRGENMRQAYRNGCRVPRAREGSALGGDCARDQVEDDLG